MIITRHLKKSYSAGDTTVPILKGIDLHVEEGGFTLIMGRSGAGKSTLLYQLGLLDHPTSGQIIIDGTDVGTLSSRERTEFRLIELGFVFQDYAILPELTAIENVMIPLLMQGLSRSEARKLSTDALEKMELAHRMDNLPAQLSGGEQQRISIARAIAHKPKILFADEPTANLDSETSKKILETFSQLHCEGQTIVMVTHEKEFVDYGDRILRLNDGMIIGDEKTPRGCKIKKNGPPTLKKIKTPKFR
jgi:putative ABC transport system ATP-binding protein